MSIAHKLIDDICNHGTDDDCTNDAGKDATQIVLCIHRRLSRQCHQIAVRFHQSGPMRAVFESVGMADVVAKSKGSSNPYNMVRATFDALKKQTSPRAVASRRGKKVADVMSRRGGSAVAE